jgi:hypothetical protein
VWVTASAARLVDLDDQAVASCYTTDGRIDIRLPARSGVVIRIE